MKRNFIIILLTMIVFLLSGCELLSGDSWNSLKELKYQDLLIQEDERYYVFFYSNDCPFCEELKPTILEYNQEEIPLYILNVDDKINNEGVMAPEEYEYFSFIGTENYYDVMLEHVPALIIVEDGKVETLISSQTTDLPKTEIEYLLRN